MPNAMADNVIPAILFLDASLIKYGITKLDIKNDHPTIIDVSIIFIFFVKYYHTIKINQSFKNSKYFL